jgi:hypothetical protein
MVAWNGVHWCGPGLGLHQDFQTPEIRVVFTTLTSCQLKCSLYAYFVCFDLLLSLPILLFPYKLQAIKDNAVSSRHAVDSLTTKAISRVR